MKYGNTQVQVGNIQIRKGLTNIGEWAFTITNLDGKDESIMILEDDWPYFLKAVKMMKRLMK